MRRASDIETRDPLCARCGGSGWVCENHADRPWADGPYYDMDGAYGNGCACGAGMPCPSCNALAMDQNETKDARIDA